MSTPRQLPKTSDGSTIKPALPLQRTRSPPTSKSPARRAKLVDLRTDNYKGGGPENVRAELTAPGQAACTTL